MHVLFNPLVAIEAGMATVQELFQSTLQRSSSIGQCVIRICTTALTTS